MSHFKQESPLRRWRRARLMNQEVLASALGVTQETVSKAERGVITLSKDLQELAALVLARPRQELFPESDEVVR